MPLVEKRNFNVLCTFDNGVVLNTNTVSYENFLKKIEPMLMKANAFTLMDTLDALDRLTKHEEIELPRLGLANFKFKRVKS